MKHLMLIIITFISSFSSTAVAQEKETSAQKDGRSFRGISLLTPYEKVIQTIKQDQLLILNPLSDFEDFDESVPNWLVAQMPPLMNQIYYHFFENKLYVISIFFNSKKTSYPELYQNLKKNYGSPTTMNANESQWKLSNNTLIVLDNLPSVKYIDTSLFEILKKQDATKTPLQSLDEQEKALEAQILADL